jgi:hypothetical protein
MSEGDTNGDASGGPGATGAAGADIAAAAAAAAIGGCDGLSVGALNVDGVIPGTVN